MPLEQHVHVVHMMLALGCFIEDQQNGIKSILKLHLNFHTPAISQKISPIFILYKAIFSFEVIGATSEWTWSYYNLAHNRVLLHCIVMSVGLWNFKDGGS